ncbi:activator of (R)-2-hydroxyglutaryl-CoA dehydratase [Halorhodospira halochloris]|uniref:Activator of (R)-2-hydroxyglutaryl-CoA dehydratase n=1 Tax=Halorhodospira halochloris TaxID=1052 RepID=A0A110B4V4_HALHR|nr:activator of (R)-2-hydroxyglutaryl-CoA dehydratase [Halorhodospira halochloris]BAU57443.1 activator of (R)-2-hydroxyglutaryl-CoA dehydratase [Halorhodospira halochloris]
MAEEIDTVSRRRSNQVSNGRAEHHYKRPAERPFTSAEKEHVTLLFGGLSIAHDRLIEASLHGLGYKAERIPMPDKQDFHAGRENCNPGQCNPLYFVSGSVINYLEQIRRTQGLSRQQIADQYIFITPGSCGPCRFGMYEAEYRRAFEKAGYPGFRVIAFDKKAGGDGHRGGSVGDGIQFDLKLYLALINTIFLGDIINGFFYRIRPYASDIKALEQTFEQCIAICQDALRDKDHEQINVGLAARLIHPLTPLKKTEDVARILAQIKDPDYTQALDRCRRVIAENISVDWLSAKPVVRITGEFWAQTTEGEGNFRMFSFLEGEGAEVHVEPVATWIDYMRHSLHWKLEDRRKSAEDAARFPKIQPGRWLRARLSHNIKRLLLGFSGWLLKREYNRLRSALGGPTPQLADQQILEKLGQPYYNVRVTGGEGHLEIAKNIYAYKYNLAHLTISLKPFGCMPSTQSDGAQAAVLADYPQINFLALETAGEGEINAYSRAQMALSEAKARAREEFKQALAERGLSADSINSYVAHNPGLTNPLQTIPDHPQAISRGACFVHHVADLMANDPDWREKAGNSAKAENQAEAS